MPRKSNAAALSEITNLINRVQIVKQIRPPLNEQMIAALALKLDKLQLPLRDLKAMADRVESKVTYGNIAYEHWIEGLSLDSEETVARKNRNMILCERCGKEHKTWQVCGGAVLCAKCSHYHRADISCLPNHPSTESCKLEDLK